ncbi:7236_t:CDS:2 [Entrophospora sp. SA101]|nr:7236_t:CDS:2 [Entrophospora sp. SA101]
MSSKHVHVPIGVSAGALAAVGVQVAVSVEISHSYSHLTSRDKDVYGGFSTEWLGFNFGTDCWF